jgi:hypothetical protein
MPIITWSASDFLKQRYMNSYKDKLIEVTERGILFRKYYFPFGDRCVPLDQIEKIEVMPPSLMNGSWRLWGSGDLRTWFPLDWKRPSRDRIFLAHLRGNSRRIGFTAEDAKKLETILQQRRLIQNVSP